MLLKTSIYKEIYSFKIILNATKFRQLFWFFYLVMIISTFTGYGKQVHNLLLLYSLASNNYSFDNKNKNQVLRSVRSKEPREVVSRQENLFSCLVSILYQLAKSLSCLEKSRQVDIRAKRHRSRWHH